mmetsp:Transcript_9679/g.19373  ORF Transcript_9679/g.19373 Transcript_9679/m.19373 type:complete len:210 (+) Transcript_9679:743-1372(+)
MNVSAPEIEVPEQRRGVDEGLHEVLEVHRVAAAVRAGEADHLGDLGVGRVLLSAKTQCAQQLCGPELAVLVQVDHFEGEQQLLLRILPRLQARDEEGLVFHQAPGRRRIHQARRPGRRRPGGHIRKGRLSGQRDCHRAAQSTIAWGWRRRWQERQRRRQRQEAGLLGPRSSLRRRGQGGETGHGSARRRELRRPGGRLRNDARRRRPEA